MAKQTNNTEGTKRFLVTYTDDSVTQQEASAILNVKASSIQNAESFMASDASISPDDVVHYEGMGISSLELTDEQAKKLEENAKVLAVEEDREMFALGVNVAEVYSQDVDNSYQHGYTDAMYEVFQKIFTPPISKTDSMPQRPNSPVDVSAIQPIPWNINLVKAPGAWARGFRGTGVKVAVLDTGVAPHSDLVISGGISFVSGVASYNDGHGHGTHCCGVVGARNNAIGVVGVAPLCSLYAVKVLNDAGSGFTSEIIAGMTWAKNNGMKVISMSLGSLSNPSVAYTTAIAQLNTAGVTVVCAAGNSFLDPMPFPWVNSPANSVGAIAVGAVDANNGIAWFSSRGKKPGVLPWNPVTLVAPGVNVKSTYKGNTYATMNGTSMATPHVAGAAVLIKQRHPGFTPAQVMALLKSSATDLGPAGVDATFGSGLLNCDKAMI
jgi:subtilisin